MSRTLLVSLSVCSLLIFTSGCAPRYYPVPRPDPLAGYTYPHWIYYNEIPPNGARLRDLDREFKARRIELEEYRERKRALQREYPVMRKEPPQW